MPPPAYAAAPAGWSPVPTVPPPPLPPQAYWDPARARPRARRPAAPPLPPAPDPWYDSGVRLALAVFAGLGLVLLGGTIFGVFQGSTTPEGAVITVLSVYDLGGVLVTGLLGAILFAVLMLVNRREPDLRRRHQLLLTGAAGVIGAMLLWLALLPVLMSLFFSESLLFCIPTTLFALWVLRRLAPNRRLPWWLLMMAAGWGCLIAPNLAIIAESIWAAVTTNLIPGLGAGVAGSFSPGLFEEGSNGLGVILLYLLFRDRIDGVIGGICLGAAVGLGFNFIESGEYMFVGLFVGGGVSGFALQFLFRQVLGLFAGHATYTALTGAGVGVARTLRGWRPQLLAVSAHFLWDFVAMTNLGPNSNNNGVELALITPLTYLALDGPFVLMLTVLWVLGWRTEKLSLATQFQAEATSGRGVVVPAELPILTSPRRRAGVRLRAMWRSSWLHYRWIVDIQEAQIELAALRWGRESERIDAARAVDREKQLAERILDLKRHPPRRLPLDNPRTRATAAAPS
jgi:RsiW-degrading membrane proteinase PrsW (M82 family)